MMPVKFTYGKSITFYIEAHKITTTLTQRQAEFNRSDREGKLKIANDMAKSGTKIVRGVVGTSLQAWLNNGAHEDVVVHLSTHLEQ